MYPIVVSNVDDRLYMWSDTDNVRATHVCPTLTKHTRRSGGVLTQHGVCSLHTSLCVWGVITNKMNKIQVTHLLQQ